MGPQLQGVVFDLGGTLVQFEGEWQEVFHRSRKALTDFLLEAGVMLDAGAFSEAIRERIEQNQWEREQDHLERPTVEVVAEVLGEMVNGGVSESMISRSVERMFAISEAHWHPEPSLHDVLDTISKSGLRLGLISNASDEQNVLRLMRNANILSYFDPIVVSAAVGVRKPAPQIFESLLNSWDLPAGQTVMVGDTLDADILGAQSVGMNDIWLRIHADRRDNREAAGHVRPQIEVDGLAAVPAVLGQLS